MRALLAIAGLLVLAGSTAAAAAKPTAHTLRKSASGPIEAVAQDNTTAAWLTSGGTKTCNAVHLLSPGKPDRLLPASSGMTCRWTLSPGQSQLAVAARMSTALWTLHESGGPYLDFVVAASTGGSERPIDKLVHASDGTGKWLGGVAGAGRTLAYSWDDVEYINPEKCLSNGGKFCKQKIAGGGINVVTRTGDTPLTGGQPALQLAAAAGRIAYVPATSVHAGRPYPSNGSMLPIVDADTGVVLGDASVGGIPIAIALSSHVLAVLTTQGTAHNRISWFSAADGTKLGSVVVSGLATQLATSDRQIVYRIGRLLRTVAIANGHIGKLVTTGQNYLGLALAHGRLIWAENHNGTGRLRALAVG